MSQGDVLSHTHTHWLITLSTKLVCVWGRGGVGHTWQPKKCDLSTVVQLSFPTWGSRGLNQWDGRERERERKWAAVSTEKSTKVSECFFFFFGSTQMWSLKRHESGGPEWLTFRKRNLWLSSYRRRWSCWKGPRQRLLMLHDLGWTYT